MDVRCSTNDCACAKTVAVEVFQTGTGQVIEHSGPVACDVCGHRWDLHSGIPPPPAQARQQPAA